MVYGFICKNSLFTFAKKFLGKRVSEFNFRSTIFVVNSMAVMLCYLLISLTVFELWGKYQVVEDASKDAANSRANHVPWHVEKHNVSVVVRPLPVLEDGSADGKSGVERSGGVPVDLAQSPKVKADAGEAPGAEVRNCSLLAGDVQDEKDEDESAHHVHISDFPNLVLVDWGETTLESIRHTHGLTIIIEC